MAVAREHAPGPAAAPAAPRRPRGRSPRRPFALVPAVAARDPDGERRPEHHAGADAEREPDPPADGGAVGRQDRVERHRQQHGHGEREPDDPARAPQRARERERQHAEVEERQPAAPEERDHDGERRDDEERELVAVGLRRLPLGDRLRDGAVDEHQLVVARRPPSRTGSRGRRATAPRRARRSARRSPRAAGAARARRGRSRRPSATIAAPTTTEPCTFAHTTSSGKTRNVRRRSRSRSDASSASVATKSGSANACARSVHDQGATSRQTATTSSVLRAVAPRWRAADDCQRRRRHHEERRGAASSRGARRATSAP